METAKRDWRRGSSIKVDQITYDYDHVAYSIPRKEPAVCACMKKHPFNKSLNGPRKGMETAPSNSPTASSFMKTLGLSTLAVFAMAAAAQAVLIDMQFASVGRLTDCIL